MWIKLLSSILLVTLTSAEYLYDSNPYSHYGGYASAYDNYKPTDYKFEYGVSDPHTGDHKSQWEVKENGVVRGAYSLLEPDGTTRLVEYYADDTGFHADVKKIGHAVHDAPNYGQLHSIAEAHVVDSLAYNGYGHGGVTHSYGAPIAAVAKVAAPVPIHAAPIAQVQHIAPVPQVIAPQIHHAGTPLNFDISHFYSSAPGPVLQHPAPFHLPEEAVHYSAHSEDIKVPTPHLVKAYNPEHIHSYEQPQILHKAYENHHQYQPEVLVKSFNYPAPDAVPQYYAKYVEPQVVKTYPEPQILKGYAEQQFVKAYAEPQLVKTYAEPQIVKSYAAPAQEYLPDPVIQKGYALPVQNAYGASAVGKVGVTAKVQALNPFAKFFAPLTKYFAAPAPAPKAVPQAVYAQEPTKYVSNDYAEYQYKPEVVISSPHNYPSQAYSFSHEY